MDINKIMNGINKYPDVMELNEPVTESEVNDFQKTNGIILPPQYVGLLQVFDGGELFVPGTQIFGILHKLNGRTIKEINGKVFRNNYSIPLSILIIGKLNYGDLLCIDLNDNHQIIQWDHENDEEFCRWNSLEEWLLETLAEYEASEGGAM